MAARGTSGVAGRWLRRIRETWRRRGGIDRPRRPPFDPGPFFDARWYRQRYGDVAAAIERERVGSALEHYVVFGAAEGRLPNPFFQAAWYRAAHPGADAALAAGTFSTPFEHYCRAGAAAGNDPGPYFSEEFYLGANADAAEAVRAGAWPNGLAHYLGARAASPVRRANPFFDDEWYLERNPDVAAAVAAGGFASALVHYVEHGAREGRAPSRDFDRAWYRVSYPEVGAALALGVVDSEFAHYCWKGARLGRSPSVRVDGVYRDEIPGRGLTPHTHPLGLGGEALHDDCTGSGHRSDVDADLDFHVAGNETAYFQRLVDLAPDDEHARALFCYALLRHGRFHDAREVASAIKSGGPSFHGLVALTARRMAGDHDGAKRDARPALVHEYRDRPPLFAFDGLLPERSVQGGTIDLFLTGWVFHPLADDVALSVRVGNRVFPIQETARLRPDVFRQYARLDYDGRALYSGFRGSVVADVDDIASPGDRVPIEVEARVRMDGAAERVFGFPVGDVEIVRPFARVSPATPRPRVPNPSAEIAICMATFNPDVELFRRQVASIREQTHQRWRLIVSDDSTDEGKRNAIRHVLAADPRVEVLPYVGRRGFYLNFERALAAVGRDVDYVALADQDDRWHPDKLQTLVAALSDGNSLAYADMRLVDRDGAILGEGFWGERENHSSDSIDLLIANTVTGAASLFRREVLDVALPFPALRWMFHDQWVALCAAALGRITYVPRPLHDYVQHGGNVIGSEGTNAAGRRARLFRRLYARMRAAADAPGTPTTFAMHLAAYCTRQWGNDPRRLSHLVTLLDRRSKGRAEVGARDLASLVDVGAVLQGRLSTLGAEADRRTLGMEWRLATAVIADSFTRRHRDATTRLFQERAAQLDRRRFVRNDCRPAPAAALTGVPRAQPISGA